MLPYVMKRPKKPLSKNEWSIQVCMYTLYQIFCETEYLHMLMDQPTLIANLKIMLI